MFQMTSIESAEEHPIAIRPWRDGRLLILLLGIGFLPVAIQASFTPRAFFDDFPLGLGWLAAGARR